VPEQAGDLVATGIDNVLAAPDIAVDELRGVVRLAAPDTCVAVVPSLADTSQLKTLTMAGSCSPYEFHYTQNGYGYTFASYWKGTQYLYKSWCAIPGDRMTKSEASTEGRYDACWDGPGSPNHGANRISPTHYESYVSDQIRFTCTVIPRTYKTDFGVHYYSSGSSSWYNHSQGA
jgi:hypothetical protein